MSDQNADQEHVDVHKSIHVSTPEEAVHENLIVPVKRVGCLNQSQALDHPNYQSLEPCQLKVQVVLAELVNDQDDLEHNSEGGHDIVKLGHHVDIVDCGDGLVNQIVLVPCLFLFIVGKQLMDTLQRTFCQTWIIQNVLGYIRPGFWTIYVYFCHCRTVNIYSGETLH